MTADRIIFLLCAFLIIFSGVMVVSARKLIHAALWLVASLFGVAILYAILNAAFLAVVQVVVYIGAIAILFIFAIMLTRKELLEKVAQTRTNWWIPALLAFLILGGLAFIILKQSPFNLTASEIPPGVDTLRELGIALVSPQAFVLPFEVASILLVAALVGAVFIASGKKK
jgi:NADH-quinone oxidoreductase subunit J